MVVALEEEEVAVVRTTLVLELKLGAKVDEELVEPEAPLEEVDPQRCIRISSNYPPGCIRIS